MSNKQEKITIDDNIIDLIVDKINWPTTITDKFTDKIRENFRIDLTKQVENCEIYPEFLDEFIDEIVKMYNKTKVSPGENVGIITAQSIGERQTQLTLNSFHQAGLAVKTVVTGVPRFTELMNTTKDPKGVICEVPLRENLPTITSVRDYIGDSIIQLSLSDISDEVYICNYKDIKDSWWLDISLFDKEVVDKLNDNKRVLRYILNKSVIYNNRLTLSKIKTEIEKRFTDIHVFVSSTREHIVDIFIDNEEDLEIPEGIIQYVNENNKIDIYLEEIVENNLKNFIIYGLSGIKDFIITRGNVDGESRWLLNTEGSNFRMLLGHTLVKNELVVSNNMWDIYNTLGIEAARQFLIEEFTNVVSSDGTFINKQHVSILVDVMTFKGEITSVSRYGVRAKTSPMARASFEESVDNFLKSGVFNETEKLNSISSSIMVGKMANTGTGICDTLIDYNKLNIQELISQSCSDDNKYTFSKQLTEFKNENTEEDDIDLINTLDTIFE